MNTNTASEKKIRDQRQERFDSIKGSKPHIKIHMFEDDSIIIADEKDRVLKPQPAVDLPGPLNTYPQIVLFNKNPICAVINGRMY